MENSLKYANENIKLLIKHRDWTQRILCNKTGISEVTMRRRLNSKTPTWTMVEAASVANAFGMTVNDLFFNRMVPKSNKEALS